MMFILHNYFIMCYFQLHFFIRYFTALKSMYNASIIYLNDLLLIIIIVRTRIIFYFIYCANL